MTIRNVSSHDSPLANSVSTGEAGKTEKKKPSAALEYTRATAPAPSKEATNVQISPKAREMSMAKKAVNDAPDIDHAKVAKLKDQIDKGTYKPDSNKIANGIALEAFRDELSKS